MQDMEHTSQAASAPVRWISVLVIRPGFDVEGMKGVIEVATAYLQSLDRLELVVVLANTA